mmetsp:Transcript_7062/g.12670  ORF Transcript_7062/g.12670 Transcript_7062/m.12670 type:complete len:534 (-) Transcript_7062:229-1830(-)|eukprot:CAMPEP_0198294612 /NCGR_PEP_ID=MMETSP1449-20131203/23298_1 /TAXON_ID=420275 /ORGANISM="Attheya septentrionalis, Strain CCMP2084" /LENGTH=533 /DNA_ID=CAMNT_0043994613 /DNA_START=241 /DNA_END=1842 /DNA_ORIENTATION=-
MEGTNDVEGVPGQAPAMQEVLTHMQEVPQVAYAMPPAAMMLPAGAVVARKDVGPQDVLCGRGGLTNHHVGNQHFRNLVTQHRTPYALARKRDKAAIAQSIVRIVQETGGRFLNKEAPMGATEEVWVQVADQKAVDKTKQALREGADIRGGSAAAAAAMAAGVDPAHAYLAAGVPPHMMPVGMMPMGLVPAKPGSMGRGVVSGRGVGQTRAPAGGRGRGGKKKASFDPNSPEPPKYDHRGALAQYIAPNVPRTALGAIKKHACICHRPDCYAILLRWDKLGDNKRAGYSIVPPYSSTSQKQPRFHIRKTYRSILHRLVAPGNKPVTTTTSKQFVANHHVHPELLLANNKGHMTLVEPELAARLKLPTEHRIDQGPDAGKFYPVLAYPWRPMIAELERLEAAAGISPPESAPMEEDHATLAAMKPMAMMEQVVQEPEPAPVVMEEPAPMESLPVPEEALKEEPQEEQDVVVPEPEKVEDDSTNPPPAEEQEAPVEEQQEEAPASPKRPARRGAKREAESPAPAARPTRSSRRRDV